MSDPGNWRGFRPDTSPVPDPVGPSYIDDPPKKKSTQEQLDDIDEQIATLDERRKELQYEVAKEEVRHDEDFLEEVHHDCRSVGDLKDEGWVSPEDAEKADEDYFEAWRYLEEFGGHTAGCLAGALTGTQKLHPLCTCGWNHVATELERG